MKQVQASLSARGDRESSFHRCGRPVRLMQDCLCAGSPDKSSEEGEFFFWTRFQNLDSFQGESWACADFVARQQYYH